MKLNKFFKYVKKIPKNPPKYYKKALNEWREEADDFFEDFYKKRKTSRKRRMVRLYGVQTAVRPAFLFAERIESLLKVIFGSSIVISAVMATFIGFTRTSELLSYLILSIPGRIFMVLIGFSYFMVGLWKLLHIKTGTSRK